MLKMCALATTRGLRFALIAGLLLYACGNVLSADQGIGGRGAERGLHEAGPLFEYGTTAGDAEEHSDTAGEIRVPDLEFNFFGSHHDKVYISRNGHVSFTERPTEVYSGDPLPLDSVPDPPLAAAFFAASSTKRRGADVGTHNASTVYYRVLRASQVPPPPLLAELGRQVRANAVTNMAAFRPAHALVVTWYQLRHDGCVSQSSCPRNTFQAVLVTDGQWTYAIYNYQRLEWLGGLHEGCDRNTGLGPDCFPPQMGFNAGYGRRFVGLPGSGSKEALKLASTQGSKVVGRYIYRVSHSNVVRDACTSEKLQPLAVSPERALMFGGTEVYVAGPCLTEPFPAVQCWVRTPSDEHGVETAGRVVDAGRAACVIPPLAAAQGGAIVALKLATDAQYYHQAELQIETPRRERFPVKLHSYREGWLARDPPDLSLSWLPELLNKGWLDALNTTGAASRAAAEPRVDILLLGFRERDEDAPNRPEREWELLTVLGTGQPNNGDFTFRPADARCVAGRDCDWHLGVIKVQPAGTNSYRQARGLYSALFPLAWYIEDVMTQKHGDDWPEALCGNWQDPEPGREDWQKDLKPCPCTADQAFTDTGNFMVGVDCDTNTTQPVPCPMSPDARVCYVSVTPTPRGAQTTCCYDNRGLLLSSADGSSGSFSGRFHELGQHPYTARGALPLLSHWLGDVLPQVWCCHWAKNPAFCMEHYEPRRRTPDCSSHVPPATAFAFGDPHFLTFDGTKYTFNGYAEYWLVRVHELTNTLNLQLQARMENSVGTIPGNLNATIITAVGLKHGTSPAAKDTPAVSFLLNPPFALHRISVYVDGLPRDFHTFPAMNFRRSGGSVTIYRHGSGETHSNFTAVTDTGVSVTVAEKAGILQVTTSLPSLYFGKTHGLFGFWDGNAANDLRRKDGVEVDPTNTKDVHEKFGVDWTVLETESIFTYFGMRNWKSFQDKTFVPNFTPTFPSNVQHNITVAMVNQKCNHNDFCTFDYMATLSAPIAGASLAAEAWAVQAKNMGASVPNCPYLLVERSLREAGASTLVGGVVTLTSCLEGYTLIGPTVFECKDDAAGNERFWEPSTQNTQCKANHIIEGERRQTAVAISVPLTLLFVATLAAVLIFLLFRKRKRDQDEDRKSREKSDANIFPRETVRVNPHPASNMYAPKEPISRSRTSLSSRGSGNSIVLTEQLVAQRPQRPQRLSIPASATEHAHDYDAVAPTSGSVPNHADTGHDNPDCSGESDGGTADSGRVQPGGPGSPRPISTVSHFGPESHTRSRVDDDDADSLAEERVMYAQPRPGPRPSWGPLVLPPVSGGYYNSATNDAGPPGLASPGRFGYQQPPPPTTEPGPLVGKAGTIV